MAIHSVKMTVHSTVMHSTIIHSRIGKDDGSWVMVEAPSAARIGYQLGGSFLTKIIN